MCDKEPYPTEAGAREAAKGMAKEHKKSMQHYWCEFCECWHVKTEGKRRRKLRRNNNKYPFRYQPKKKK
jgi:hypothetical protein